MALTNDVYLLVHTMTITESCYVVRAQFVHAVCDGMLRAGDARLVGRWVTWRLRPRLRVHRIKAMPKLKGLMKTDKNRIRHHLRTVHIGTQNRTKPQKIQMVEPIVDDGVQAIQEDIITLDVVSNEKVDRPMPVCNTQLTSEMPPKQTATWLAANRFDKYVDTFANFCGADLLRMSRDDLIQICGKADGIRLYNVMNSKMIAPKLTIYIRQENTNVYNAVFLNSFSWQELRQKLALLQGVSPDQVKSIYMQGPQSIHIQLNNDVLKHIKEETLFSFDILEESASYIFVLKPAAK